MSSYSEGQVHQLADAFERAKFTPDDLTKLGQSRELLAQVRHLVRGTGKMEVVRHLIDCDATPFIPKGWRIKEKDQLPNRVRGTFEWDSPKLAFLHLSPNQMNGKSIDGKKIKKELVYQSVLPANVLDYLLAHPELIPESWKKDDAGNVFCIFFWGTEYCQSNGVRCIRYLYWDGQQWRWNTSWLVGSWDANDPAAVLTA